MWAHKDDYLCFEVDLVYKWFLYSEKLPLGLLQVFIIFVWEK